MTPSREELRRLAEEKARKQAESRPGPDRRDFNEILQDLETHQVELEMQNEELRAARTELETALQRFTEIFDFAPIGYFVLDGKGNIKAVNLAAARLLRRERRILIGMNLSAFIFPGQRQSFLEFLARTVTSDEPDLGGGACEVALMGESSEMREIRLTATHLDREGPIALCAAEDITLRKLAEAALRDEARNKDAFLAVLSHELRNPLAPIRNSLFLLERVEPGGEQARQAREVIDRQVSHLTRIVDDLLDVTRISRGKVRLEKQRIELTELVRRTVEDHRQGFVAASIALESSIVPDPVWIDGDANRIIQIIGNLLGNALKFTSREGRVTVSLTREGNWVALSVRDTGMGVAPELRELLFQPFHQAPQSLDHPRGGLGLGLAMVKGLAELHGGSVELKSRGIGKGSEFVVRLPLAPGPRPAVFRPRPKKAERHRVLVVEDNLDASESLRQVLQFWGHEVAVAHNGAEGLALARLFRPEVVLCDIGLPGMDGYALATAIRDDETLQDVVLVALSGYALGDDVRKALASGFDRHLAKPADMQKLEEVFGQLQMPAQPAPRPPGSE